MNMVKKSPLHSIKLLAFYLFTLFLLAPICQAGATPRVILKRIEIRDLRKFTRIRFLFKKNFPEKLGSYQRGKALTLLFRGTHNGLPRKIIPVKSNGVVKDIRILRYNRGMRVVINLKDPDIEFVRYQMKSPPQVVVSLRKARHPKVPSHRPTSPIKKPPEPTSPKPVGTQKAPPSAPSAPPTNLPEAKKETAPGTKPSVKAPESEKAPQKEKVAALKPEATPAPITIKKKEAVVSPLPAPAPLPAKEKKKSYYFLSSLPQAKDASVRSLFSKARIAFRGRKFQSASKTFSQVMEKAPATREGETSAFYWARSLELWRGKKRKRGMAHQAYETILKRYPNAPWIHEAIGNLLALYEAHRDYPRAIKLCRKILKTRPDTNLKEEALFALGKFLTLNQDYPEADDFLHRYLETYPNGKYAREATFYLGDTFYYRNNVQMAARTYQSALKRWPLSEPNNIKRLLTMANAFTKAGQFDRALTLLFDALNTTQNEADKPVLMFQIARLYEIQGKFREAMIVYSKVKSQFPGTNEAAASIKKLSVLARKHPRAKSRGF